MYVYVCVCWRCECRGVHGCGEMGVTSPYLDRQRHLNCPLVLTLTRLLHHHVNKANTNGKARADYYYYYYYYCYYNNNNDNDNNSSTNND